MMMKINTDYANVAKQMLLHREPHSAAQACPAPLRALSILPDEQLRTWRRTFPVLPHGVIRKRFSYRIIVIRGTIQ